MFFAPVVLRQGLTAMSNQRVPVLGQLRVIILDVPGSRFLRSIIWHVLKLRVTKAKVFLET